MAWALCLTAGASVSVTDDQLAELDEFELVSRGPNSQFFPYLRQRLPRIAHALICAAGAVPGRSQMLRSVSLLHSVLDFAAHDPPLLRSSVRAIVDLHLTHVNAGRAFEGKDGPLFLAPLVSIAVNRVADRELAGIAGRCLGMLFGCSSFDRGVDDAVSDSICEEADQQTRRWVGLLIKEVKGTASPEALTALASLLRRDFARLAFCEADGISVLAWTLGTVPGKGGTVIASILAERGMAGGREVEASYQAVFIVWMLSFAVGGNVRDLILTSVLSSRLLVVLGRLLNHGSGQRLKIARVILAAMRNLASGDGVLNMRVRRDLLAAEVSVVVQKLLRMGSGRGALLGNDEDAMEDARVLAELLGRERETMSTLDSYITEVKACALHWSPVHKDTEFWVRYAQKIVEEHRDVLKDLVSVVRAHKAPAEEIAVACNDLSFIMRESVSGKAALLSIDGFKQSLMKLMMSHEDAGVREATLTCTQYLIMKTRLNSR